MSRIVLTAMALTLLSVGPAAAKGMTPPGKWLTVIKDAIRAELKDPEIATFNRIFFASGKVDGGGFPVCGFVGFKQKTDKHPTKQPFFGLITPPDTGIAGKFESIRLGTTAKQADEIAQTCKQHGIY
ncbi:MAG: hypothetical protein JWM58_1785 [Rhizobium sp.]|nr:hypothetical protein [Rhizobium sp.]